MYLGIAVPDTGVLVDPMMYNKQSQEASATLPAYQGRSRQQVDISMVDIRQQVDISMVDIRQFTIVRYLYGRQYVDIFYGRQ